MSVIIYTYRDPYKLKENKELWKEISSCPYFCAAQTLVNGLKVVYGAAFQIGRVTTVKNLTDVLYEKWNGTACAVKQHADIDNIIVNSSDITGISRIELDNVKKSFLFNRDQLYTAKGGDAVEKRQETLKKRADLMAELSNVEDRLHELMADALPMLLVEDLVVEIKLQATDEHTDSIMQEAVLQLDNIFEDFAVEYLGDKKAGIDFIEYVKKHTEDNQIETVYGLSEQALFQTNNLVEGVLKNTADETKIIIKKKKKLVKQISEFDSYLMLDINDKELKNIHKKIKAAEQAIIDDQVKIAELEQRRGAANSRVMTATSEFGKYVEAYLSTAELKDSSDRIIKYSNIALNVIEKYRIELQKRKTNILAATITDCYLKLANKKNLIQTIVMDPESLDLRYLSENGAEVPKDSLSAGEQQLMVISILWALALCSKKKLPVIIDTPLSRLDSLHRTALITTYFPNAGEQTIILSTDSEIDAGYYQLMKENIGDEFTLNYDENSKSTSIERGYLIGAKL